MELVQPQNVGKTFLESLENEYWYHILSIRPVVVDTETFWCIKQLDSESGDTVSKITDISMNILEFYF